MKHKNFILSALAALFIAGTSSAAQDSGAYASVGLTGLFTKFSDTNFSYNFWGPSLALGYRLNRYSALQIETAYLTTEDEFSQGGTTTTDTELTGIPLLVTFSLCAPLGKNDRLEIRLSPTAGAYRMQYNDKLTAGHDENDTAFACGLGASLVWNIGKHLFLDFNFRYLRIESLDFGFTKLDTQHARSFNVSCGWKF